MFERFTKDARAVVVRAHEEAAALGAERIASEHLLLGLAAGRDGVAGGVLDALGLGHAALRAQAQQAAGGLDADALASIGIDLDEVRRRAEETFGPGALSGRRRGRQTLTPTAKKALELALREAIALGDRHIGSEHVLLGLMRDPADGVPVLLERLGRAPDAVGAATLAALRRAA